jgi:hypothetical protein
LIIYQLVYISGNTETIVDDYNYCINRLVDLNEGLLKEVNIFKDKQLVSNIRRDDSITYDEFEDKAIEYVHIWRY